MEKTKGLTEFNEVLRDSGLPTLRLVDPAVLKPQDVNARYMDQQTMDRLVENIKTDGRLESVPLCYEQEGVLWIISGHHRIEAAVKASQKLILVMITEVSSKDQVVAKQLSHNAISGRDDDGLLARLSAMIQDIDLKLYSGVNLNIEADIDFSSIGVAPKFETEFTLMFLPEEIEKYDRTISRIAQLAEMESVETRLLKKRDEDPFRDLLIRIKKERNIKSNAVAFQELLQLANERLDQIPKVEKTVKKEKSAKPEKPAT